MFAGMGLFFLIAAVVWLALTHERRKDLVWLAPVALALGAWYLAYGRSGTPPASTSLAGNVAALPLYTVWGLGAGAARLIGECGVVGPVVLLLPLPALGFSSPPR